MTAMTGQTPNPSALSQSASFTFTVTATAPGSGTPTGTVTVTDGTQSCNATVAAGSCSIAFTSVGGRTMTAGYAGDGNFALSTSARGPPTVGAAGTATPASADNPDPAVVGAPVSLG